MGWDSRKLVVILPIEGTNSVISPKSRAISGTFIGGTDHIYSTSILGSWKSHWQNGTSTVSPGCVIQKKFQLWKVGLSLVTQPPGWLVHGFFKKGPWGWSNHQKKTASPAILVLGTSRRRGEPHNSRSSTSGPRQPRRLSKKMYKKCTMFVKSSSDTHISVYASYSKCTITSAYYRYLHIQCIYIYIYSI